MTAHDIARIRFVTGRFHELQTLPRVLQGAMCFGVIVASGLAWLPSVGALGSVFLFALLAVSFFGCPWLAHRLEEAYLRYGRVSPASGVGREGVVLMAAVLVAWAINWTWDSWVAVRVNMLPLVLAGVFGRIAIRDWPWRWVYAVPTLVFALATVLPLEQVSREVMASTVFVLMLGPACLDHLLLTRALGRPSAGPGDQEEAEPATSR